MGEAFTVWGGANVGWVNSTFPLARLRVSESAIELKVIPTGRYIFKSESVIDVVRHVSIPFFGWGIRINHTEASYPNRIIFWSLSNPDKLLERIRLSGFRGMAPESAKPSRAGWAIRWQATLLAVLVWNGLFLLDRYRAPAFAPGLFALLALGLTIAAAVAILRVEAFRQLVLKPGRHIGEIRPLLNLLLFVGGFTGRVWYLPLLTIGRSAPQKHCRRRAGAQTKRTQT